jgi:hypothetical protein
MVITYEYWQDNVTGQVWAVKLENSRVVAAVDIRPDDVSPELLPYLPYSSGEAAALDAQRKDYRRIDGRP